MCENTRKIEKEIDWLLKEKYSGESFSEAEADVNRLRNGEPVAYVIGYADFLGCRIDLSAKPLIPRPETEYWTEQAIAEIRKRDGAKVLDIFAGSGCVGIAVLKHVPAATVDFAEKNKRFLLQIKKNLKLGYVSPNRYHIIQSDLFSGVSDKYDFILANPPYVAADDLLLADSVKQWEPKEAVVAGETGFETIEMFLKKAGEHLVPGGVLYMEFGSGQENEVSILLESFRYAYQLHKDQFGMYRYAVAQML